MCEDKFHPAAALDDIADGAVMKVEIEGKAILLCNSGGQIFAVSNRCSHADELLDCGMMRGGWIACPAHGARFDLASGEPLNPPATQPITAFEVRERDGMIEVRV